MTAEAVELAFGKPREAIVGPRFASGAEMQELLGRVLETVNADDRVGPILAATGVTARYRFQDPDLVLEVWPSKGGDSPLQWQFGESAKFAPKLELVMRSTFANRYLQGRESLPIAIARGFVKVAGESRASLLFLPAARLLIEPYRRRVAADYPHLRVAS